MTTLPSAPDVCLAITRRLRRSRTGPEGSPLLTKFPEMTAEAVMGVVRPVLEERDEEIARLRGIVAQRVAAGTGESGSEEKGRRASYGRAIADIMAATDEQLRDAIVCLHPDKRRRLREFVLGSAQADEGERRA